MKKLVGGVVKKYMEEGKVWSSWKRMWLEVKGRVECLVEEDGMREYRWMGEEDGSCWDEV